jgi:tripartite-type tricarboxylate transporter receptor subunit TctC
MKTLATQWSPVACSKTAAVIFSVLCIASLPAYGQSWPAKPIRAIVPIQAGSAADIVPRLVLEHVSSQIGQPIVIENRPGAGGTLGAAAVASAPPDGHTILAMSSSYTITPSVYRTLPFDPTVDLAGVTPFGSLPSVLVVTPSKGWTNLKEFVEAARGGKTAYASVGAGTAMHLSAERFRLSAGFASQHVPFKGAPQALTEVMTGRIDFAIVPLLPALPFIRDGKLIALAANNPTRSSTLPNVPTTLEAGYANSEFNFWLGMFVPAKTPRGVVDRLYRETQKALQEPSVRAQLAKLAVEPMPLTPDQFNALIRTEIAANAALTKAAGIEPR